MGPRFAVQLGLLAGWSGSLAGQTGLGWRCRGGVDLAFRSRYEWRGVARTSGWVTQPDAFFALQKDASFLTVGAWTNVDLAGGAALRLPQQWFGETDGWLEAATRWGGKDGARRELDLELTSDPAGAARLRAGAGPELTLSPARLLHDGPGLDVARFPAPPVRLAAHAVTGSLHERRWLAQAATSECGETGWALHEVVHFGARVAARRGWI